MPGDPESSYFNMFWIFGLFTRPSLLNSLIMFDVIFNSEQLIFLYKGK